MTRRIRIRHHFIKLNWGCWIVQKLNSSANAHVQQASQYSRQNARHANTEMHWILWTAGSAAGSTQGGFTIWLNRGYLALEIIVS